jgi:nitrate/nitrite transport system substrate-binding protein
MANVATSAILNGIFQTDVSRRGFLKAIGSGTAMAAIGSIIPFDKVHAAIVDAKGPLENSTTELEAQQVARRNFHYGLFSSPE